MADESIKTVSEIVVDPQSTRSDVYNMWRGFIAVDLPPVEPQIVPTLVQPIINHFNKVITGENKAHTNWLLDYLANMVQRPHMKSNVAISLYGNQGCGKGIIFEFFCISVLGMACSFQTANPENDILGRFSNGYVNKVLIQVDEVKSLHDYGDKLKNLITNPTLNYEKKGKDIIVVKNLSNLIFTSNNENALNVPADDRRFVLFRCSSVYKGDTAYFNLLGNHLQQADVARGFYQFLMGRDLSRYTYDFQSTKPITAYYKESQIASIEVVDLFFSAKVNSCDLEKMSASDLYSQYVKFHKSGNHKFLENNLSFGRKMAKIGGIKKTRNNVGNKFAFDRELIKKHLIESNKYDSESFMD
jgi:putative DNA primase/helicase